MVKLKRQDFTKYTIVTILLVLATFAKIKPNMLPLSMGIYVALIYCGLNFAIISPLYLMACLFNGLTIQTLIYACAPVIIYVIVLLLHKKLKKRYYLTEFIGLSSIALLPQVFLTKGIENRIYIIASIILILISIYLAMSIFYAIIVRKAKIKFSIDEKAAAFVVLIIESLGLAKINIYSFRILYLVLGFLIILCVYRMNLGLSSFVLVAISLGQSIAFFDASAVGGVMLTYFIALAFKKLNKYVCAMSIVLADVISGVFLNCYVGYDYLHILAVAIGLIIYLLIPSKIFNKILNFDPKSHKYCVENTIKREKQELIKKLNNAESVIYELADNYCSFSKQKLPREELIKRLSNDVVMQVCHKCKNKDICYKSLNISQEIAIRNLIDNAIITGKTSINDLPYLLAAKCENKQILLDYSNSIVTKYLTNLSHEKQFKQENLFLSMQMAGVGSIFKSISDEIRGLPIANKDLEEQLISELGYSNIVCSEALFITNQNQNQVAIVVREQDVGKSVIENTINHLLKDSLVLKDDFEKFEDGFVCCYYESRPKYDLAFYNLISSKNNAKSCGDTQTVIKLKENKALLILCDGMGTGKQAQDVSSKTLSLVQNFYKAGLDNSKALVLINRALSCVSKDTFTAVDMCVVDLNYASIDFIKLGAVSSFIKRSDGVQIINSSALPLGIVDSARPCVTRDVLTINDIVVLLSDGISDVLSEIGIKEILTRLSTQNPKTICEEILGQAKLRGLNDDASIIAFKIFKNVS